ncbi:reprolysin-like metallopeptidase [Ferruginibacter yonginensis]|uniref:Reprolysin-like metallopeptidase n=1 Tax=Ferruginibacter yonginensis TaxID=1310416 RepID=A0ABV8QU50_9BACT
MRKIYQLFLTVLFLTLLQFTVSAQKSFFVDAKETNTMVNSKSRVIKPSQYRVLNLDNEGIKSFLSSLPQEKDIIYTRNQTPVLAIPMPDGTTATFHVWESSIQEPALQAKFSDIRTYAGQGISDPYATIRFDYTPRGFHAQVLTVNGKGTYYVDPYAIGNINNYISYFRTDLIKPRNMQCGVSDNEVLDIARPFDGNNVNALCRGTQLYAYRLAVACTGEYAQAPGVAAGTNPALLHAAIVTTVNRVNGVYESDLSIRLILIANNATVEFLDAATDPFNGNNNANTLINESQTVIDGNIGPSNYDIGHTFSTGGGGLAQLGCVCGTTKARGITGSPSPTGDAYDIDYVAHEVGHQFGGSHTFNSTALNCAAPNRTASSAYEVGSGTTIQAYAGICGSDNIQNNSDPFFHPRSFDQISDFLEAGGASCRTIIATGNTLPVATITTPAGLSIPPSTPFTLVGTATDANGDALTYCWEQWDLGPTTTWNGGNANTTSPLFKSRVPKITGSRTFPDNAVILANYPTNPAATLGGLKGETLPTAARTMNFRLTVRDNRAGGGGVTSVGSGGCQSSTPFTLSVSGTTPFVVTAPNGGESYVGGSTQTITWDVASTNVAPISTANVKISLSTDGGLTYPTVLLASTANDGTEAVVIPNTASTTARVKVEAINNVFFDVSNANFTITVPPNGFSFGTTTPTTSACPAAATLNVTIPTTVTGTFTTPINLTASGVPTGTTVTFAPNPVTPGISTVATLNNANTLPAGTYNITVTGTAGAITNTTTISFVINQSAPPVITAQPQNVTVCAPATANFSVTTSTSGVTYQWQTAPTATGTFTNIAGATAASYTTGPSTGLNGRAYRVIVSTQCSTVTSNIAVLTENSVASITTQPTDVTVCNNAAATFTVQGAGTGVSYQWQQSAAVGGPFVNVSTGTGGTSNTYTTAITTPANNNTFYRVQLTTACGGAVTSNVVRLTVNTVATITTQPTAQSACVPNTATFSVAASGTGLTYQWQVSTNGGTTFTDIAGAVNATYTTPATTLAFNNNQYRVNILSTCSPTVPVTSNAVVLTVNNPVTVTANPTVQRGCAGDTYTFSVAATGGTLSYQWQVSTNGGTTFTNVVPGIPANPATSGTAATYTINNAPLTLNGNLYRVIVSGIPCGVVTTPAAALILTNRPTVVLTAANATSLNPSINSGLFTTVSPVGNYNYVWLKNGSVISNTNPSLPINVDGFGSYQVSITDPVSNCVSLSNIVRIDSLVSSQLFIYPNPVSTTMQVRFYSATTTSRNATLNVYDAKGARVFSKGFTVTGTYGRMDVDMSRMQQGTYLVELRDASGKQLASGKVVKGL